MSKRRAGRTGVQSIGRRLSALGFNSYADYLASAHWQELRVRFFASKLMSRVNGKACCEACRQTNIRLSVHHRTYKRMGAEWLMDLMAVCDDCHKKIHDNGYKGDLWGTTSRFVRRKRNNLFVVGQRRGEQVEDATVGPDIA